MVIFDCNGVLVDSELIAAEVLAEALGRIGLPVSIGAILRRYHGRRPADVLASIEAAAQCKLPADFAAHLAAETLRRLRAEVRPVAHAAYTLTWIRGTKAVASSAPRERIRACLETTGLARFFEGRLFSASDVRLGKPAPDLLLLAAARCAVEPADCIVVEDSVPGVTAAVAAGMTPIGFVGGSHAPGQLADDLLAAGARHVVADMRTLKSMVTELRGW